MRIPGTLGGIFLLGGALLAQTRSGGVSVGFGNVVFPGGATAPGVQRNFPNVVFPSAPGVKVGTPFSITDPTFGARLGANIGGHNGGHQGGGWRRGTTVLPYAYPVYVGGYYDPAYQDAYPPQAVQQPVQQPQQPNIIVVYPQQAAPVIVNQPGSDQGTGAGPETVSVYQAPVPSANNPPGQSTNDQPSGYLIALKNHTIYSAVAYWVDGDTLHYFTSANTHNQASLALVDRDLTEQLNRELGNEIHLPK